MVQNSGYIFDKKYRVGQTLLGKQSLDILKNGKRIDMKGISRDYKIDTADRENVFSYSIFGALDLTENLAVNARYTSMFSDGYDADMIGAGFEYKMDTMARNLIGPLFMDWKITDQLLIDGKGHLLYYLKLKMLQIEFMNGGYLSRGDNVTSHDINLNSY